MKKVLLALSVLFGIFSCKEEIDCCVFPIDEPIIVLDFSEVDAQGCSDFYVYKELSADKFHLTVNGNKALLGLDKTSQKIQFDNENLNIELIQFKDEIGNYACDDVAGDDGEILEIWTPIAGEATIQIVEDSITT